MGDASVTIHIKKVIFENFNDLDIKLNNDQIFEILKQNKNIDQSLTINDMEIYFKEFCDAQLYETLLRILLHNGLSCLNYLRKFNANLVKMKII